MKWIGATIGIAGAALFIVVVCGSPVHFYRGASPNRTREVLQSKLPEGSPVSSVIAYLDANSIEHSQYVGDNRDIGAIRRNTCWAILIQCDIELEFAFDRDGRLQRTSVKEGYTGL